jgi:uncharacterized membrane protein YeaQ/YmgE (transglycosylase-associated protein family)
MTLSNDSVLTVFVVGIVAGWLAGQVVRGGSFGLIGDLVVGVVGAFVGDRVLPQLHIALGVGMVAQVIDAAIGAIVCCSSSDSWVAAARDREEGWGRPLAPLIRCERPRRKRAGGFVTSTNPQTQPISGRLDY